MTRRQSLRALGFTGAVFSPVILAGVLWPQFMFHYLLIAVVGLVCWVAGRGMGYGKGYSDGAADKRGAVDELRASLAAEQRTVANLRRESSRLVRRVHDVRRFCRIIADESIRVQARDTAEDVLKILETVDDDGELHELACAAAAAVEEIRDLVERAACVHAGAEIVLLKRRDVDRILAGVQS